MEEGGVIQPIYVRKVMAAGCPLSTGTRFNRDLIIAVGGSKIAFADNWQQALFERVTGV